MAVGQLGEWDMRHTARRKWGGLPLHVLPLSGWQRALARACLVLRDGEQGGRWHRREGMDPSTVGSGKVDSLQAALEGVRRENGGCGGF